MVDETKRARTNRRHYVSPETTETQNVSEKKLLEQNFNDLLLEIN